MAQPGFGVDSGGHLHMAQQSVLGLGTANSVQTAPGLPPLG